MRASFYHLVRSLLPYHKRQTNRLALLRVVMHKFDQAMNWLADYRKEVRRSLNITAQTIVLKSHLNNLFDPSLRRIIIKHYDEQSLPIGLIADGVENYAAFKLNGETYTDIYVSLLGESQSELDVDYIIRIPAGVSVNSLLAELNKYRLAGKTFTVQNY